MNADHFIVARVSSETKARLHAFAEREQLSESALLRRLVEFVLLKAGYAPIITETPTGASPRRTARLMIRLCARKAGAPGEPQVLGARLFLAVP